MRRSTRRGFLAATGVTALAGCVGGDGATGGAGTDRSQSSATTNCDAPETTGGSPTPAPVGPTTGDSLWPFPTASERLPLPMSRADLRAESRSGGPPKDGIPSIDEPAFVDVDGADFLEDRDVVFGVVHEGVARAYPQRILAQHEIVNDVLAGVPVAVTYCPLTGTAMGFLRGDATFGVSGRLINNNLVMYDRVSETWWPQILATSIPGPWNEAPETGSLREFGLVWTRWEHWREHHPDTEVLSTETGYARNYRNDPYGSYIPLSGYYAGGNPMFPALDHGDRYDPKTVVLGARTPDGAAAFHRESLRSQGVLEGELGGTPVLAVFDPRYDTGYVYANPDERSFTFDADCGHVVGDETTYAPDSLPLARVYAFDAMWFAWSGYYPETTVYE